MAEWSLSLVGVNDAVGITELGVLIFGFLNDVADIRNTSLTNKVFHHAAQFIIWRAITLPCLAPASTNNQTPFWDRFATLLERRTLSLCVDMSIAAPGISAKIAARQWEAKVTDEDPEWYTVKEDVDSLFDGLKKALTRTRRLRNFTARHVPQVLDLFVLLQSQQPNIESLNIAASKRDTFGLHAVPAVDLVHWNLEVWHYSPTVPLANSVNSGIDLGVAPAFDFSRLRILCLDDLQYDGCHPSPFVDPLVSILKGTPDLEHLKLSCRLQFGGATRGTSFLEGMYNIRPSFPSLRIHGIVEALCLQYRAAGGQPLRLKTMRLGYGCEIMDRVGTSHYIQYLTNPPILEELHVQGLRRYMNCAIVPWAHGFMLLSSRRFPEERCWTGVRKTTWPWGSGLLLTLLCQEGVADQLSQIIFRIASPTPEDWIDETPPTWASRAPLNIQDIRTLTLGGLVLPTEFMSPQDGENFFLFVPWVKGLRVLKIRMPFLTSGRGRGYRRTFYRRIERMTELRHSWLADGRGTWRRQDNDQGNELADGPKQFVPEPYPTEVEFQRFSTLIAAKCPELVYLRILDRAWTITRPGLGD